MSAGFRLRSRAGGAGGASAGFVVGLGAGGVAAHFSWENELGLVGDGMGVG